MNLKKIILFLVTKEKPFQVRIYKIQKSEKVFKKKLCWQLGDLKVVDGISESQVGPFLAISM